MGYTELLVRNTTVVVLLVVVGGETSTYEIMIQVVESVFA